MAADRRYVSVVGGSDVDATTLARAEEIGRILAEAGTVVVTGGRQGVAEATSRGAAAAGGLTLGILPEADRRNANPHVGVAVTTGMGDTRNALVAMNGDVVIALDGGPGTLSEIAHALVLGRPVVVLGTWELTTHGAPQSAITRVDSASEAAHVALDLLERTTP